MIANQNRELYGRRRPLTRYAIAFVATLAICALPVTTFGQISLSTAVDLAQRNSSAVKLAEADFRKATALYAQSKDVYIPSLVLGSGIGPPAIGFTFSQASVANATVQSLFFSYPQRRYVEAAREGVQAATFSLKDAKEQASLEAATAYIELDTVTVELTASRGGAQDATRLVEIEQQREEAGVDSASDLLQARLTEAQIKLRTIHLESRAATLIGQLSALTGLPPTSIQTEHASIPMVPAVTADHAPGAILTAGIEAARAQAGSKESQARGDFLATKHWPLIGFGAQYNRDATSLNNYNTYFSAKKKFKADNFNAGFTIQIPVFDVGKRDKSRETAADALRATVEAEQAQRQNDVQIATLTASLRELDAFAEVVSLKQQIAAEQLKTVQTELQSGNGAGSQPGAPPQLSPKSEQLARIDERQKFVDSLDAAFDLTKARLNLLRAFGHMEDWLAEIRHDSGTEIGSGVPATEPVSLKN